MELRFHNDKRSCQQPLPVSMNTLHSSDYKHSLLPLSRPTSFPTRKLLYLHQHRNSAFPRRDGYHARHPCRWIVDLPLDSKYSLPPSDALYAFSRLKCFSLDPQRLPLQYHFTRASNARIKESRRMSARRIITPRRGCSKSMVHLDPSHSVSRPSRRFHLSIKSQTSQYEPQREDNVES